MLIIEYRIYFSRNYNTLVLPIAIILDPDVLSYQRILHVAGCMCGVGASNQVGHSFKQTDPINVPTSTQATSASSQVISVSVRSITHHDLGFKADWDYGIGSNGEVIIGKFNSQDFYMVEHAGNKYTQKYRNDLPNGMDVHCRKAIDGDRIFLQNGYNKDTICYNTELKELCIIDHKGLLIDCIGDKLFYGQGTLCEKDWKIVIGQLYRDEESVPNVLSPRNLQLEKQMSLQLPAPHYWEHLLSICHVKESYAVVESFTHSLDIFDDRGMICVIALNQQICSL